MTFEDVSRPGAYRGRTGRPVMGAGFAPAAMIFLLCAGCGGSSDAALTS